MSDKKDNKPDDKGSKPDLTTSSSLDKPLLDEKSVEKTADIDTSHLSLDESTGSVGGSLENEPQQDVPEISTSHLSVEDEPEPPASSKADGSVDPQPTKKKAPAAVAKDAVQKPAEADDDSLVINNPYVKKPETSSDEPEPQAENKEEHEQVDLTSHVSDAEFEKEAHAETTKEDSAESDIEKNFNADDTGAIKQLLDTVKKPETVVRSAWSNSSARRYLLDNVDSYREKDEDHNMEEVIEKMYGGTVKGKFLPGKFLKENLLFSSLFILLIFLIGWKVAGFLFPDIMPAINDQIIESVQQTTRKAEIPQDVEKKPIVTNVNNKEVIDETLSHCLIVADARSQFTSAFSLVGYEYTSHPLTLSYEEISDSINVWNGMNMDFFIQDAILRHRVLSDQGLPAIKNAHKVVTDYRQTLIDISDQADALQARIKNIQTAGGNQTTGTINRRIPLRNELDSLNARLAEEPPIDRFSKLLSTLVRAEQVLSGQESPKIIDSEEFIDIGQKWLVNIADEDAADINNSIQEKIISPLQESAEKLATFTPKLTGFHLSELEIAVKDLLNLSSLITYLPETRIKPYNLELHGLNRRLNKLMKEDLPVWISTDQCLSQKRTTFLSNPE